MVKSFDIFHISNIIRNILDDINKSISNEGYHFIMDDNNVIEIEYFDFLNISIVEYNKIILDPIYLNDNEILKIDSTDFKDKFTNSLLISYIVVYFDKDFGYNTLNIKLKDSIDDVCLKLFNFDKKTFVSLITKDRDKLPMKYFKKYEYLINAKNFDLI